MERHTTTIAEIVANVRGMPHSATTRKMAREHGLDIVSVAWEDNARDKNSAYGPCITDMTLQLRHGSTALPIVRYPNMADLTWDARMDDIKLFVGNERGQPLTEVTLTELLGHVDEFLGRSSDWRNAETKSLLAPSRADKDAHVLMGAQACFLPVPAGGGETEFNVAAYNYQSTETHPAVLLVLASREGTSIQLLVNGTAGTRQQLLFHNQDGQRCTYVGKRLSQDRVERGVVDLTAPMTKGEAARNFLYVIQVPLVVPARQASGFGGFSFGYGAPVGAYASPMPMGASTGFSFGGMLFSILSYFLPMPKAKSGKAYVSWGKDTPVLTDEEEEERAAHEAHVTATQNYFRSLAEITIPQGTPKGVIPEGAFFSTSQLTSAKFDPKAYYEDEDGSASSEGGEFDLMDDGTGPESTRGAVSPPVSTVEHAIIKVGAPDGPFFELCQPNTTVIPKALVRDARFPVRVTLQFWKATSNGVVSRANFAEIAAQFTAEREKAKQEATGSLVTDGATDRPTEWAAAAPHPAWFGPFYETNQHKYRGLFETRQAMGDYLFKGGRFRTGSDAELARVHATLTRLQAATADDTASTR